MFSQYHKTDEDVDLNKDEIGFRWDDEIVYKRINLKNAFMRGLGLSITVIFLVLAFQISSLHIMDLVSKEASFIQLILGIRPILPELLIFSTISLISFEATKSKVSSVFDYYIITSNSDFIDVKNNQPDNIIKNENISDIRFDVDEIKISYGDSETNIELSQEDVLQVKNYLSL